MILFWRLFNFVMWSESNFLAPVFRDQRWIYGSEVRIYRKRSGFVYQSYHLFDLKIRWSLCMAMIIVHASVLVKNDVDPLWFVLSPLFLFGVWRNFNSLVSRGQLRLYSYFWIMQVLLVSEHLHLYSLIYSKNRVWKGIWTKIKVHSINEVFFYFLFIPLYHVSLSWIELFSIVSLFGLKRFCVGWGQLRLYSSLLVLNLFYGIVSCV